MGHYEEYFEEGAESWQGYSESWKPHNNTEFDVINKPKHYNSDPSGIEPIQITQHMSFCLGNVVKYVIRAKLKGTEIEDLKKAAWYLNKEIERLESYDKNN